MSTSKPISGDGLAVKRVSVKDVAARSGVSFQTTSKVLNGKGSVSDRTRKRILLAAKDLGYVPNILARSLVIRSTRAIGLVAGDFSDPNLSRFIVGAEQEARRQGQAIVISSIDADGSGGDRALRALIERRVDGVLLAAPQMEEDITIARLLNRQIPTVSLHHVPGGQVATVGSDHSLTGRLATRHLIDLGHRRIATITGPLVRRVTQSRLRGYRQALDEAGIRYDGSLVEEGDWQISGGFEATRRLLSRRSDLTAIFVHNDTMAIGALSALHGSGMRVPEQCAVVGCDDIDIAAFTIPPLSTVRVPFYETGEKALQLLLQMIATGSSEVRRVMLPVQLVPRASSGSV
ncbi:MAG TPA: LacI family DNA-binding transcriptional regulator [Candidatus Angelobacter sp.]|nr:LacI family DNA-binding transcriptional regulator [Candidatus Angelobacter sp.]